jgi:uncharacterized tellurite resistance protein B-like protein
MFGGKRDAGLEGGAELFAPDIEEKSPILKRGIPLPFFGRVPHIPSKKKAFYALLLIAAHIDRSVDRRELQEINALAGRTKTLRKISLSKRAELQEKIEPRLASKEIDHYAELAARRICNANQTVRASAFMHVLDILYADQMLTDAETKFIKDLAIMLQLRPTDARDYIDIIRTKNAY